MDNDELRKLAGEATPGPWYWADDQMSTPDNPVKQWTISPGILIADTNNGTPGGDRRDRANAAFIAAARTEVPRLLDENDALRAALTNWQRAAEYWAGCDEDCSPDAASSEIMSSGGAWPAEAYDTARAALSEPTT